MNPSSVQRFYFDAIVAERARQDELFGVANSAMEPLSYRRMSIISKTVGDANAVLLHMQRDAQSFDYSMLGDLSQKFVEIAASALQALEALHQLESTLRDSTASDEAQ